MNERESKVFYLSGESYSKILEHLGRKDREKKKLEQDNAYKMYLKEKSAAMEDNWTNSIKNIEHRERQRRKMKALLLEEKEKHKMDILGEVREYQNQKRKKFMDELRKELRMKSEPNYVLSKALLESQIRAENAAFLKFKREKQQEENEREAESIKAALRDMQEFKKQEKDENCEIFNKNKLLKADQLKQINEKLKNDTENRNSTLKQEKEYLEQLRNDLEKEKNDELENFKNRRREMKNYIREDLRNKQKARQDSQIEDEEFDTVCKIYNDFTTRRRCQIEKQKNEEKKKASEIRRIMGLSNKQVRDDIEKKENDIIKKYQEEMEQQHQDAENREIERKQRMKKERNDYYSQYTNEKCRQEKETADKLRYDTAERFKFVEQLQEYEKEKNKKIFLMEVESNTLPKINIDKKCVKNEYEIQDEKFFSYAKEVLEYARNRGMDDQPIRREINKYCKDNQLPLYPECLKSRRDAPPYSNESSMRIPKR